MRLRKVAYEHLFFHTVKIKRGLLHQECPLLSDLKSNRTSVRPRKERLQERDAAFLEERTRGRTQETDSERDR